MQTNWSILDKDRKILCMQTKVEHKTHIEFMHITLVAEVLLFARQLQEQKWSLLTFKSIVSIFRISVGTFKLCLVGSVILFVVIPLIFKHSLTLQQGILFLTFSKLNKVWSQQLYCNTTINIWMQYSNVCLQLPDHRTLCSKHRKMSGSMAHGISMWRIAIEMKKSVWAFGTFCQITLPNDSPRSWVCRRFAYKISGYLVFHRESQNIKLWLFSFTVEHKLAIRNEIASKARRGIESKWG